MLEVSCAQTCPSSICPLHPHLCSPHPPAVPPQGRGSFPALPAWGCQALPREFSPGNHEGCTAEMAGGANPGDVSIHLPRRKESRKSHPCPLCPWTMCHCCGDGDFSTIPDPWFCHLLPEEFTVLTITYSKGYMTSFLPSFHPCCLICSVPILSCHQKVFFTPKWSSKTST